MASTSGEMRATIQATMQDLYALEQRITLRQEAYEKLCDEDRKTIRGKVDTLGEVVSRVEEKVDRVESKTDAQTDLIQPIADMFRGIFANPKVQSAAIAVILAFCGYASYRLSTMTNPQVQNQPIVIYQQPTAPIGSAQGDAGTR